jgi:prepilin-type N-terminal cleavage/methylation domain-containing protein
VKRRATAGFSLIEALVVVSIVGVLAAIAIPMSLNAMKTYRLTAAVAATTGAIKATRYQAIMHGYQYQITVTSSSLSYQVYRMAPPATTFSAVGSAVPIARVGDVTMSGVRDR